MAAFQPGASGGRSDGRGRLDALGAPGEIGRDALGPARLREVVHLEMPVLRLDFGEFTRLQCVDVPNEVTVFGFLTEHEPSSLCLRT